MEENQGTPSFKRDPIEINREYDASLSVFRSTADVDRSNWRETVLSRNEDIKKMRELVNPLQRAISFAKMYLPDNRVASSELVLSLISQHLRTLGLVETQGALHREWDNFPSIPHKQDSQLAFLAQRAIYKVGRFWDINIPSCHSQPTAKLTQQDLDSEISKTIGSTPKLLEDTSPLPLEEEGDPNFIKMENDQPVEMSLNQLIYYSTSRKSDKQHASELMKAMCLTISSYCSNKVFYKKICDRTQMVCDKGDTDVLILCIKLLREWITGAGNSLEPEILDGIQKFVDTNIRPRFPNFANQISVKNTITNPTSHLLLSKTEPVDLGPVKTSLWSGSFELTKLPPAELARQLTAWSYIRYYAIQRVELLDCAWEKPRLKHRAPNVVALSNHFNIISTWAAAMMMKPQTPNERIDMIKYFIAVLDHLFKIRNYYDTVGILGGLDSNALFRMKIHFSRLTQQEKDILAKIQAECSPDKNFANLRKLFDEAIESKTPSLPYIGVLLSDLFKFDDATQPFINGLMNIRKVKKVYQMISRIEQFAKHKYMFLPIDQVQEKIDKLQLYSEDDLVDRSLIVEPEGIQTFEELPEVSQWE